MNTKTRITKLEKTRKPKPKEEAAQVVIYRVGDPFTASAANVTVFLPDNLRDMVTK